MFDKIKKGLNRIENSSMGGELKDIISTTKKEIAERIDNSSIGGELKDIVSTAKKEIADSVVRINDSSYHLFYDPQKELDSFHGGGSISFADYCLDPTIIIPGLPEGYQWDMNYDCENGFLPIFDGDYPKEYEYKIADRVLFRLEEDLIEKGRGGSMKMYNVKITAEGKKYIKDKVEAILKNRLEIDSSKERIEVLFDKHDLNKVYYKYKFR